MKFHQLAGICLAVSVAVAHAHDADDPSAHALQDAIDAEAAANAPAFVVSADMVGTVAADERASMGSWSDVIDWPHIPVSAANLPDGRILTFASNKKDEFPDGPEYTHAVTWNPATGAFLDIPHDQHDMFCGHLVMLDDGTLFVNGGRAHVRTTSTFDYQTNRWQVIEPMKNGRWYPTSVALTDGRVFTALGSSGGRYPEIWEKNYGWKMLTGIDLKEPVLNFADHYEQNWWPFFSVTPQGDVLHYGPTPLMHRIDPNANHGMGSLQELGVLDADWYPKHSASALYAEGQILLVVRAENNVIHGNMSVLSIYYAQTKTFSNFQ